MGNCLVTKLKESVQNDNLNYLEKVCLIVPQCDSASLMSRLGPSDLKLEIVGGGHFEINGTSYGTVLTSENIPTSTEPISIVGVNSTNKLFIYNKYTAKEIWFNLSNPDSSYVFDFDAIDYCGCEYFTINNAQFTIQLKKIHLPNITNLNLQYNNYIVGDIASFGNLTTLTSLLLHASSVSGKIEDLVLGQRENGRNSGSIANASAEHSYGNATISNGSERVQAKGDLSWSPNVSVSTNTDITCGEVSITIDSNGNVVL